MVSIFQIASLSGLIGFILLLIAALIGRFYKGKNSFKYHKVIAGIAMLLVIIHAAVMIKFKYFN